MVGSDMTAGAVPFTGPAPPPVRGSVEPRAVEKVARTTSASFHTDGACFAPATVMVLLRSSAQQFEKVLDITGQPTAAGAMSGFTTTAGGGHVDTYA